MFHRPRCKRQRQLPRQARAHLSRWTLQSSRRRSGRGSPSSARSSPSSRMLETLRWWIWWQLGKRRRRSPAGIQADVTMVQLDKDARDKAARRHWQVGEEIEALRLLLEAKNQAWMVAASALQVAQQEVDAWATRLRREQEQVSAAAMQGASPGNFSRGSGLARRDAAPPFGERRGHRRRSGSRLGACFRIRLHLFSRLRWHRRCRGLPRRSPPAVPPQLRVGGPREDGAGCLARDTSLSGGLADPARRHHCGVTKRHVGSR